jgi:SAM-dependent methyltransferase
MVRIAKKFVGPVLDAGCGTGENALHAASLGLAVTGVDVAETAIALAREKAAARGLDADFAVADAFQLNHLGQKFQTVLDCGLFHTFNADERALYVASLASVTGRGAAVYILCFSDAAPDTGPHPIREDELRAAFAAQDQWRFAALEAARIETRFHEHGAPAWLASIQRT